ncbi:MAG TPA: GerW family sporulation protein [Candidatus Mcinerneyibacteriales bacterium]|jgi:uncharacterized spore protein YtfJ|nr:GerW family sporulation protein [Candidatus Mcinerneyibacteriales bacterium]HPE21085.1 GerW family sporulation protein [Candidatus Mcinerneyibacteriales bacterium]HPJ69789.1 GerW family sporulation protein [Candidatus Mcinerneyibacteriales bacterium]HPQ88511.1 GerW family sporulation protein [Candidatus Mcinerneyibacteriales bacterium]
MEKTADVLDKLNAFVKSETVTGTPMVISDEITVIPFTKVAFGLGTGNARGHDLVGIGGGISPVGFLVINKGEVSFVTTGGKENISSKVIDLAQDVLHKAFHKGKDNDDGDQ